MCLIFLSRVEVSKSCRGRAVKLFTKIAAGAAKIIGRARVQQKDILRIASQSSIERELAKLNAVKADARRSLGKSFRG